MNAIPHAPLRNQREGGQARLTVKTSELTQIISEGSYVSASGARFPMVYSITYDIAADGVVLVDLKNTARAGRWFRWLRLSGGAIKSSLATFISWMPEQFGSEESSYQFRPIGPSDQKILSGLFIPWFWLGNAKVGMEVST